jgi:hypothetical protein
VLELIACEAHFDEGKCNRKKCAVINDVIKPIKCVSIDCTLMIPLHCIRSSSGITVATSQSHISL